MTDGYLLPGNERASRPRDHVFVDVESWVLDPRQGWSEHRFRLGWAQYWRRRDGDGKDKTEWQKIRDPASFWAWCTSKARSKQKLRVIAHNVSYDFLVLDGFTHLPALGWTLAGFLLQPGCTVLRWQQDHRRLDVVDSANWLKAPLATWGDLAGFPKLDVNPLQASDQELDPYCHRDVELLSRLVGWWYRYPDHHDTGDFRVTLPAQAFQCYRHRFMDGKVHIHKNEGVSALEREGYHGGRVECFKAGEWQNDLFYKLDVNSMYPFAMWAWPMPCALEGHTDHGSVDLLAHQLESRAVVARVQLDCDLPYYPYRSDNGIVYPTGRFETVLTTPELKLALEHGWVKAVKEMAWYRQEFIFREYVEYWYKQKDRYKKQGLMLHYQLAKGFLNYLYGKFGQRSRITERIGDCDPRAFGVTPLYDSNTQEWFTIYQVGGGVFQETIGGESRYSFPAISAHVTAYARLYLYKLIEAVGRDRVLYCDTDSVIVDSEGYKGIAPWLGSRQLGRLKVERVARYVNIRAPKDYQMDGHVVLKGVRRDAEWQGEHQVTQTLFPSIKGTLRLSEEAVYRTQTAIKRLQRVIRSGVRLDDNTIDPFEMDEWAEWAPASPLESDGQLAWQRLVHPSSS